ncbi:MAG: hypothetical protein IT174_06430 [Acidobacteria bacterium]|nr:hypothetical protein [Acidobacteriota bacterium]
MKAKQRLSYQTDLFNSELHSGGFPYVNAIVPRTLYEEHWLVVRRLGILSNNDLADVSPMLIKNRRGEIVGRTEAANLGISDNKQN